MSGERSGADSSLTTATRRSFLRAVGAGATAAVGGSAVAGSAAAQGIPTPWLHRDGKWIRDPSDNEVVLRGLNVPDAKRMNAKEFRPDADETIERATSAEEGWYTRIVRLPVQPLDIGGHDAGGMPPVPAFDQSQLESYVENHLRPAVDLCAEQGVYCIVDYHRHRGQSDEYLYTSDAIDEELTTFWETVAPEFAEDPHVLYEVYNEPIAPFQGHYEPNVSVDPTDDEAIETWRTWKEAAQPWVDTIREHAPRNLILIGSPRWSQWTYQAPNDEFEGDNLAYVGHVYAHENLRPLSEYFGTPAEEVPVFLTEFGWGPHGADYLKGTAEEEGQDFLDFFEAYENVHWQVWCFDSKWSPAMLDHDWSLNAYGQFWKDYLAEKRDAHVPGGESEETPTDTPETPPDTPEGAAVEPIDGTMPTDPNGDGLYEDLNGNGEADYSDVVRYFNNMDEPAMTNHTAAYDYNGNGEIDFADLVDLFGAVE
ncbi:cellulase family glycosylhydrolase [Halomicrobium salinisoli]|uniref:cellulase family glycosylhydrolase n=1 Tax=Halomicrobium salinisoli TaxID=2878391 RepID=UPI001CF0175D|nr:cellulase family glycosylhydrolase [Halomicrobium salinisoli]